VSHRKDDESGCWLPNSWKLNDHSSNLETVVETVQAELNADFDGDSFNMEFPAHTLITDRTFTDPLVYILCDDRQKLIISSEEGREGVKYFDCVAAAQSKTHSDQDPVSNWPIPFSEAHKSRLFMFNTHKAEVNIRYVPKCDHFDVNEPGFYLKSSAESELVNRVKESFLLKPAKHTDDDIKRMISGLPFAFRVQRPKNLEWHVGGYGNAERNLGSIHVLGVDRRSNTLYFFTAEWDYTP